MRSAVAPDLLDQVPVAGVAIELVAASYPVAPDMLDSVPVASAPVERGLS